jgi:hypothetical protein
MLGAVNVGILFSLETDLAGRVFLVLASVAGWTWFAAGLLIRWRRQ